MSYWNICLPHRNLFCRISWRIQQQDKSNDLAKKESEQKTKTQRKPKSEKAPNTRKKDATVKSEAKDNNEDKSINPSERKDSLKGTNNSDKVKDSTNKPVENIATKENVKVSNKVKSNELPKEEPKQEAKKAKDWGRASNDPRNKV